MHGIGSHGLLDPSEVPQEEAMPLEFTSPVLNQDTQHIPIATLPAAAADTKLITVPFEHSHKRASGDSQEKFDAEQQVYTKQAKLMSKISVSELVVLEICAGSANLSAEFRSHGFQVLPIDHKGNIHRQKVRTVLIDLSAKGAFQLIQTILLSGSVYYVHMGPPCGTASAARNKVVPRHLVEQGAPSPPPLRSIKHPLGFPWLTGLSRDRVLSANAIYSVCSEIAKLCLQLNIIMSIENPLNSLFWAIPFIASLVANPLLEWVVFQACMHGSTRNKWTAWLSTKGVFSSMAMKCNGAHTHAGWNLVKVDGKWAFDTAAEAEYPRQLCSTAAQLVLACAIDSGFASLPVDTQGIYSERQRRLWKRATTGKLPRGRALPQLISEFESVSEVICTELVVPKNSRLLRRFWRKGESAASDSPAEMINILGRWRTPEKFVEEALQVQHPYDSLVLVPDELKVALFNILTLGPLGIARKRTSAVMDLNSDIKKLSKDERALHDTLDPYCERILAKQRLLLFKKLLDETQYQDTSIVSDIMRGFDVVGSARKSTVLSSRFIPATTTPDELRTRSKWSTPAVLARCTSSGDQALDEEIYKQTLEQRDSNWLRGPLSKQDLELLFPEGWTVSRRFGIQQGEKVRVIDDCKEPGINHALATTEKLSLMDTDDFTSLLRLIMDSVQEQTRKVCITLSNGKMLTGTAHPSWYAKDRMLWSGRTLDLESAYKHLPNSPETRWAAVLAAFNPKTRKPELFISDSLMFGSTASVYAFNRFARALWHIAVVKFDLLSTQFFDDFPSVEPVISAVSARIAFEALLTALGWTWSAGKKCLPFQPSFPMLGNIMDVSDLDLGRAVLSNKPSRVEGLQIEIESILHDGKLASHRAAELSGKLQYTESQVSGRASVPAVRIIRDRANDKRTNISLTDQLTFALRFMQEHLKNARPRVVSRSTTRQPVSIFTDGSSEGNNHLWGAVVYFPGRRPLVAGGSVPTWLVDFLKLSNEKFITQVELYPVILLKCHFGDELLDLKTLWWIDNDGARDSLISGTSASLPSMKLLSVFYRKQGLHPSYNWFGRVPSFSNPSDKPSRNQIQEAALSLSASIFEPRELSPNEVSSICS